ncbi:RHS repeat domain-containing protein [Pseudoalteromonas sp. PA2MD11]|uniref:RHS repeat domain-containing protein n=1 Tax=Pseudoalteromonas sp. PA2MD11 TaxID=2785057 RepID=UPI001ADFADD9|nr:RHS repeat domain-containing protein [Pseudoalteromonas sp. PA2MD11]
MPKIQGCSAALLFVALGTITINDALASTVSFEYDARGRLKVVKESDTKLVTYSYDDAGNRTSSANANTPPPPPPEPVITSKIIPNSVRIGVTFSVSWTSRNTSYCKVKVSGDANYFPTQPSSGSVSLRIYENTPINITCFSPASSTSFTKIVRVTSSGGPGGLN